MENFFDNPTTLRNPADFVGRQELLERIFSLIKGRQSVSLVGPRRIGKTSLLNCLKSPIWQKQFDFDGDRFLFFYLDLQKRSLKTRFDFVDEVYQIIKVYAHAQGYSVAGTLDTDDELNALLDDIHQHGLHPVLLVDTFDEIIQYKSIPDNVFSFLRSLGTVGSLSYVIASVEGLNDVFRRLLPRNTKPSPFPNIFATVRLTSFRLQEAQKMLVGTSTRGNLPFTETEVQWILQLAGTHPFLLHQVATLVFEQKRLLSAEQIDYDSIREEVQQNLFSHFEDCWDSLASKEQKTIIADAKRKTLNVDAKRKASSVNSEQPDKGQSELQEMWDSRIYPEICRNELFLDYLQDAGHLEIFPPELKDALEHFDNPGALGEGALIARLPFIEKRMQQPDAQSTTTRGRILQGILTEALENMRGLGQRSDPAHDWVYYNILYYRYFNQKQALKLDVVASRLGISDRQYYRLFPKAIEQLWKELQTMDGMRTPESKEAQAKDANMVLEPGD